MTAPALGVVVGAAAVAIAVAGAGACADSGPAPALPAAGTETSAMPEAPVAVAPADPAAGFEDHQEVAGYTITRVPAAAGAALPPGVGDVAAYDITDAAGNRVARYLRIVPAGGGRPTDSTVASLLADLAGAHGGGTPRQSTIAGLPSWEVAAGDGTVGIARASEDGPVVVFIGADRAAVESMIDAVTAALDTPR